MDSVPALEVIVTILESRPTSVGVAKTLSSVISPMGMFMDEISAENTALSKLISVTRRVSVPGFERFRDVSLAINV